MSVVVSSCLCLCSSSRCRLFAFWVCHYCIYCTSASTSSFHCSAPIAPTVLRPTRVHCTTVRLLHLLCFGPHESIAPRCPYCTYCTSSYMSSVYRGAPTVPIVFRPTSVRCTAVGLLYLLYFGLYELLGGHYEPARRLPERPPEGGR